VLQQSVFEAFEKIYAYGIDVKTKVTERGTGEVQEASHNSQIHRESRTIDFSGSTKYFYPHLPYFGKVTFINIYTK